MGFLWPFSTRESRERSRLKWQAREAEADAVARRVFAELAARFPSLTMEEHPEDPVEISIVIPEQEGCRFRVWLALQNCDELHLLVENFWLEWFPCTTPKVADLYLEAVSGFLSGEYRIMEYSFLGECYLARLQKPQAGGWKTIGTWTNLGVRLPGLIKAREIRNHPPPDQAHPHAPSSHRA
ncbi:MAG: hypothetical protein KF902_05650 [Phycisphaeraceae bacterium]|nr:hypothetical protein [Phycisphaeraceae bacterium]